MSIIKTSIAASSILCLTLAVDAYSAGPSMTKLSGSEFTDNKTDSHKPQQNRNPVIQELERHSAFSSGRDLEYYLEYVLGIMQTTPDYEKGFGAPRRSQHSHDNRYQPDMCRDEAHPSLNIVHWDGITFDHTGTRPLIEGTDKNDLIIGTDYSDFIFGYGGADKICAKAGDDIVYGDGKEWASELSSDGVDVLFGGPGNDILYGGGRTDYLVGGADHDTLLGGHSQDWLEGDAGVLSESPALPSQFHGDDFMVGMEDYEWYYGQGGYDVVNDYIYDSPDDNTIPAFFVMDEYSDGFIDICHVRHKDQTEAYEGGCEIAYAY